MTQGHNAKVQEVYLLEVKNIIKEEWCYQIKDDNVQFENNEIQIKQQEDEKTLLVFFRGKTFRQLSEIMSQDAYKKAVYTVEWDAVKSEKIDIKLGIIQYYSDNTNLTQIYQARQSISWTNQALTGISIFFILEGSGTIKPSYIRVKASLPSYTKKQIAHLQDIRARLEQLSKERFQATQWVPRIPIKVASILDEFSFNCFKYEVNLVQLDGDRWAQQIEKEKPDLLFVESAWYGNNQSWKGKIARCGEKADETLTNIVKWCKENKIPTIFWNKEGSVNWEYFEETSRLFEYIFVTDENIIEKQKQISQHNRVYILPFAAQPVIHNPINKNLNYLGEIAFAGSWYGDKHPKRLKDIEILLEPALQREFDIYDRNYDNRQNLINMDLYWPIHYWGNIVGNMPYTRMAEIYKYYDVFLNVNSIQDSEYMISRRVYEIMMSKTLVITPYSKALENGLGKYVKISHSGEETIAILDQLKEDKAEGRRAAKQAYRYIIENHTYWHRVKMMLEKMQYFISEQDEKVTGIVFVTRPGFDYWMKNCFENQIYAYDSIICIYTPELEDEVYQTLKTKNRELICYSLADSDFVSKMSVFIEPLENAYVAILSNCYFYGQYYLKDYMDSLTYIRDAIIGKESIYVYDVCHHELTKFNENKEDYYTKTLIAPTLLMKKSSLIQYSEIILGKVENFTTCNRVIGFDGNMQLYAEDAFNCCFMRSENKGYKVEISEIEIPQDIRGIVEV